MTAYDDSWAMTPEELVSWLQDHVVDDPRFAGMISDETRQMIADAGQAIRENAKKLEGKQYGRVIVGTMRKPAGGGNLADRNIRHEPGDVADL